MKGSPVKKSKAAREKGSEALPLVPRGLLLCLWLVALGLPNLVYSGVRFADTLHIIKWTVAGAPIALALFAAGCRLFWYGRRIRLTIDLFGALWALLLVYCAAQPLWVRISSVTGLIHEFVCFAAVWAFYVLSVDSFPGWGLRPLLWLANVNAAVNVLFAELQIRGLNDLAFLKGTPLDFLRPLSSLILPTPDNYIGNTAQQNMFGLWMAICVMSAAWLFVSKAEDERRPVWKDVTILLLMAVNFWGIANSTSRSGIFSLFVGLLVVGAMALRSGRAGRLRFGVALLLMAVVFQGASVTSDRVGGELVKKTQDIVQNAETVGGRIGIWTTSAAMFKEHPLGVGVGQYKWHYLEAQREAFKTHHEPWYAWQYTHWAHNEFLQWFCEAGFPGGLMLLLMYGLWFAALVRGVARALRTGSRLPPTAVWACALVMLISFNAFWTRPFHRIENILWLTLAFALTNREFLTGGAWGWRMGFSEGFSALAGAACAGASLAGLLYLGSGIQGNLLLRQAISTQQQRLQLNLLEEAAKHPIVREEARRNLGYHYLQVGDQTGDPELMGRGFGLLWEHFRREPHSEDMSQLLQWAQRFQDEDVIRELASYLKPGSYHLERRLGTDSQGRRVGALVVANGPGPLSGEPVSR